MTLEIIALVAGLILATFAAAAETSLTSVSRIRIRTLCEEGNRRARRVAKLHEDPNGYLSTILSVNTVSVIVASTATTLLAIGGGHSYSEAIVTAVFAILVLIFCEIAPKSMALQFNERVALALSGPVAALTRLLRPIISALTAVSTVLLRVATRDAHVRGPFVTEQELKLMVTVGEEEGVVEQEEREMIHGVLELTDKLAREVMVPRVDVIGVDVESGLDDVVRLINEHGHSRIPVYEKTMDNVAGVVYAKDVLRYRERQTPVTLRDIAREAYFTPETKRAGELLHDMQQRKVHIAIVVDEYGGTAGIVTIEDLIEEIVGEIRDEYDIAEQEEVQFLSDHEVLMNARVSIDDVKELLHIDIADADADSIGGLVYERLGDIPKPGATVSLGDATLVVESVRRQSIRTVRITSPRPFVVERNGRRDEPVDGERHDAGEQPGAEQDGGGRREEETT
ncbi:MAG TPA: hemolysin family protein [Candidatus Dormibacteraeota bacterium]|nr:hemolysin family protein [Candidatus Dormibacteraeota bacterium]